MSYQLIRGDATSLPLADDSVDAVVTSPPYFSLRAYQDGGEVYDGQIGSEATPQEFLEALWAVAACSPPMLQPRRQRDPATAAAWGAAYRMPFMPAPHPRPAGHRPGLLPPLRGVARRRRTEVVEISRFVVDRCDGSWLDKCMETTAALEALATFTAAGTYAGHNGAGTPWHRGTKIINGHRVRCFILSTGTVAGLSTWFEVDHSAEPLALEVAAERVA